MEEEEAQVPSLAEGELVVSHHMHPLVAYPCQSQLLFVVVVEVQVRALKAARAVVACQILEVVGELACYSLPALAGQVYCRHKRQPHHKLVEQEQAQSHWDFETLQACLSVVVVWGMV